MQCRERFDFFKGYVRNCRGGSAASAVVVDVLTFHTAMKRSEDKPIQRQGRGCASLFGSWTCSARVWIVDWRWKSWYVQRSECRFGSAAKLSLSEATLSVLRTLLSEGSCGIDHALAGIHVALYFDVVVHHYCVGFCLCCL